MTSSIHPKRDTNSDNRILALAAFFEGEFSIDWLQELTQTKASRVLMVLEKEGRSNVLARKEGGLFCFVDKKRQRSLREFIPAHEREHVHRQIAEILSTVDPDDATVAKATAEHLLHVKNHLEGCRRLCEAGNLYRRSGQFIEAFRCYTKAMQDLRDLDGQEADALFMESAIGYSKCHTGQDDPKQAICYLQEATQRAERTGHPSHLALLSMYLAHHEWLRGNEDLAFRLFHRGSALAKDLNGADIERALLTGKNFFCFSTGRFKEAISNYEEFAPRFAEKHPDHRLSLSMSVVHGICYAFIGEVSQGLRMIETVRSHALKIGDHDTAATAGIDMGLVLTQIRRYEEALDCITSALEYGKRTTRVTECYAAYYMAYIYYQRHDLEQSTRCLQETLKISSKRGYGLGFVPYLLEICWAMEQGEYPRIHGLSLKEEINRSLNAKNIYVQGVGYRYLAQTQRQELKPAEQIAQSLNKSLTLLQEAGQVIELAKTKLALGRHHLLQGLQPKGMEELTEAANTLFGIHKDLVPDDLRHLVKNLRSSENLLEEIFILGDQIICARHPEEVVPHILTTANRITGAERGAVFLLDRRKLTEGLVLSAGKNLTDNQVAQPSFRFCRELILESALTERGLIRDIGPMEDSDGDATAGIKSCVCVPMRLRGNLMGVLYHDNRLYTGAFKDEHLRVLGYFASLAAMATDNAKAYGTIRRLHRQLRQESQLDDGRGKQSVHFEGLVGVSAPMRRLLGAVERVAATDTTVLILGETGVGKEMVARAIHRVSPRCKGPFVTVQCSTFPEGLISSELFGHEKGSFTGAVERRIGRFEMADRGTIFLDEIGDIPMEVQLRLLRVLQRKEFERVGGKETIRSDFRLLAATNINLENQIQTGGFRHDLYYRLNVFPINVPPLRERKDDIAPLSSHFLKVYADKMGKPFRGITRKEMEKLLAHDWPGNVRELENVIERGVILNSGPFFKVPELRIHLAEDNPTKGLSKMVDVERQHILSAMERTGWKIYGRDGAAELLGLHHSTLYSRMKKLGIKKPSKSPFQWLPPLD